MNLNKIGATTLAGLLALLLPQLPYAGTLSYRYDALNRLVQVAYSNGRGIDYAYDAAGNLTGTVVTGEPEPEPDNDHDGIPDATDPDDDNDGVADAQDAFPLDPGEQLDTDHDGIGNNADTDDDADGKADGADNCPLVANRDQADGDHDGIGNACDPDYLQFCWDCMPSRGGWRAILNQ
ncbi:RHS repeat domain-containing protein [uncultured Lamprocystis sp.]|jgi:YD repeat-containing protein|uniref:RHS repeat domain-containing protein n=1 Tax=uncultured Lamprocystis sp. TaxID=543132 RepID=UPI0025F299C6|nr:RHS repeat domain-containing protein [uncultured Lamprocystis sp.]